MAVTYKWEAGTGENASDLILKKSTDGNNYTEVATISGGYNTENVNYYVAENYITVTEPTMDGSTLKTHGTIELKQDALGTGTITLKLESNYAGKYQLGLEGVDANGKIETAGSAADAVWKISGADNSTKTATYYAKGTPETWTLGKANGSTVNNQITYTAAAQPASGITITGLKKGLTVGDYTGTDIKITAAPTTTTGASPTTTPGTITIGSSVLPDITAEGTHTVTLTGNNYNLALASGIPVFDSTKGTPEVTKIESTTATITRTQSAGWKEGTETNAGKTFTYQAQTNKTLATITNLNTDVKAGTGTNAGKFGVMVNDNFVEAITINPTTKVVTLAKEALNTLTGADAKDITIVDGTGNDDADTTYSGFTLAISGANSSGKLGGEAIAKTWALDSSTPTTAYYKSDGTEESWQLDKTTGSETLNKKITYTAKATPTNLVTITNLNSAVVVPTEGTNKGKIGTTSTNGAFVEGITISDKKVTLKEAVLTTTAGEDGKMSVTTTDSYSVKLADSITQTTPTKGDITLDDTVTNGKVNVNQALSHYWTTGGEISTTGTITYTAANSQVLAEITNLNQTTARTKAEGEGANAKPANITLNTTSDKVTITLGADALTENKDNKITVTKKEQNALTVADGHNFELALASGIKAPETTPTADSIKLGKLDTETGEGKNTKQIEVYGTLAKGWTVDGDKKSITFKAAADKTLATITGLVSGITKVTSNNKDNFGITTTEGETSKFTEVITLDKATGTVKLAGAAIDATDGAKATLTNGKQVGELTPAYKLALLDSDEAPGTTPINIKLANLADDSANAGKKKVDVVGELAAGYKIQGTGDTVFAYVPVAEGKVLATITGLSTSANITEGNANISLGTTDTTKKTVTIKASALTDGDVVITPNAEAPTGYDTNYKLAVGDDVPYFGKTVKDEELDYTDLKNGNVKIKGKMEKGWSLDTTGDTKDKKITFKADATAFSDVATISGLKKVAETTTTTPSSTDGDGEGGADGGSEHQAAETNTDITLDKTTDTTKPTVKLKQAALTNSNVTLTSDYSKYQLALDSTDTNANYNDTNKTFGFKDQNYWEKSNTTAKYYSNETEGWTLATTGDDANKKITYTAQSKGTLLATITNLNANFTTGNAVTDEAGTTKYTSIGTGTYNTTTADNTFVSGVQVTDSNSDGTNDTITLSKNVLGTKDTNVTTLTNSNRAAYVLALDARSSNEYKDLIVPIAATNANVWELGATSKYKAVETAFWTLDETNKNKITYTAQTAGDILATITGLNPNVTEADLTVEAEAVTTPTDPDPSSGEPTPSGTESETPAAAATKLKITLNAQALNKKGVTITSDKYELALNTTASGADILKKVATPTLSNTKWSLNSSKTTATYTGNITEGYELANDHNSVIYTPKGTGKTIATVTGLNGDSNLAVSSDYQSIGVANPETGSVTQALSFNTTTGKEKEIVLKSGVLGDTNIAVTGTNYTLAFDSTDNSIVTSKPDATNVWRLSNNGTTATYKSVIKPYYTIAAGDYPTSITYHAETTAKVKVGEADKDGIFATVTGLKSGLTVATNGLSIKGKDDSNTEVDAVKINDTTNTQIDLNKAALGTSAITVTKGEGATADYTLYLGNEETVNNLAPKVVADTYNWSLDSKTKTTAYLKANTKEGWTLDTTVGSSTLNKKITYTAAATNKLFATLTGLKSGLTNTDLNGTFNTTTNQIEGAGVVFDGTVTKAADGTTNINGKIKLNMRVLGEGTVALTVPTDSSNVYELDVDTNTGDYKVNTANNKETPIWEVSGTTATFKNVYDSYYTVGKVNDTDTVNNKITYKGQENLTGDTGLIMKLEGLKSGLKVVDNAIAGIDPDSTTPNNYVISTDVLGTTNVKLTAGEKLAGRTFTLQADVAPVEGERYWTVSGNNAKYQYNSTAGYTQATTDANGDSVTNQEIVYHAAKSGNNANTIATIGGLKSGVKKADLESGIVVAEDTGTFTLSKDVLGTTNVNITKGTEAKSTTVALALATDADIKPAAPTTGTGWVVGTDSLTLKNYTTAGYTLDNTENSATKGQIVYSEGKLGTTDNDTLAVIKGLKTNLKVKDIKTSGDIDGIVVDKTAHTVTLAKGVLNAKDVTIDNKTGTTYTLELVEDTGSSDYVAPPKVTQVWTAKNGTATLTETLDAGYQEDGNNIKYTGKEVLTTTITGLKKSTLPISTDKTTLTGIDFAKDTTTASDPGGVVVQGSGDEAPTSAKPVATVIDINRKGTFTLSDDVIIGNANIVITTKSSVKNSEFDYKVALQNTAQLKTADGLGWYKKNANDTTATYKMVTEAGYTQTSDYKITYNKTAADTVYATIKGIAKTATEEDLKTGITRTTEPSTTTTTDANGNSTTNTVTAKFTINDKSVLGAGDVSITGNGDYKNAEFVINETTFKVTDIKNENATWTYNSKKGGTASLVAGKTEGWEYKSATDHKTLKYTKAVPKTIATVTNLVKGLELGEGSKTLTLANSNDPVVSFEFDSTTNDSGNGTAAAATATTPYKGKVTVSFSALNKKNVVVAPKVNGYNFTLDVDTSVTAPEDGEKYWTSNGKGTIQYKVDTTEGYKLNADTGATQLTYSKAKTTTLATIGGLVNAKLASSDSTKKVIEATGTGEKLATNQISGITVDDSKLVTHTNKKGKVVVDSLGEITLSDASILGTGKITVSGNYKFVAPTATPITEQAPKWYFSGGTATYRKYNNAGYEVNDKNAKIVNFKKETPTTTLVTIKGLVKKTPDGTTINNDNINDLNYLKVDNGAITLEDAIVGKATVTLVEGKKTDGSYQDYTFADAYTSAKATVSDAPVWEYKNGTATLKQHTSEGYTLKTTTDKKDETKISGYQLVYSKDVTPTVATVKNLATGLVIPETGDQAGQIFLESTNSGTGEKTYTPVLSYDAQEKIITILNDNALAAKNVTMTTTKTNGYTLQLNSNSGGVTQAAANATEWVVSGTTANYKNYDKGYYSLNEKNNGVVYTKPTAGITYATVTGLKKNTTFDANNTFKKADNTAGDATGGILTLTADNLGTSTVKIASKVANNNKFLLKLSDTDTATQDIKSDLTKGSWSVKGGKATLSGTQSAGFVQEFGGKQLTYLKADKNVTIATITGLSNNASVSDTSGVVKLKESDLNKKTVTVTTALGNTTYKLDLDDTAPTLSPDFDHSAAKDPSKDVDDPGKTEAVNKKVGWAISGSAGTLKGYVPTSGYALSGSETAITYTAASAKNKSKDKETGDALYSYKDATTLATIKGVYSSGTGKLSDTPDSSTNKISLSKSNINGNTLTLNGGIFAVEINDDVTGKTINGSAGADNITANGTKLNITGGKGDDVINLASSRSAGNTLVYNNGDGNDVVTNFDFTKDKLQVKSGAISVGLGCENAVIVKVGAGSINLGQYTNGTEIDIYDKNNKPTTYAISGATGASNVLLEDNNYSMDAASLSNLVQGDSASYTPYDFSSNFSLTKEDKLTPQISYSGSDKK